MGQSLKTRDTVSHKLDDQMRLFIAEYLKNGCNGAAAARHVGVANSKASQTASKWLRLPAVRQSLQRVGARLFEESELTAEEILNQLKTVLRANLMQIARKGSGGYLEVDQDQYEALAPMIGHCVTEVSFTETEYDDGSKSTRFRIKLMSKDKALELAMKYAGLLTERHEHVQRVSVDWDGMYGPPELLEVAVGDVVDWEKEGRGGSDGVGSGGQLIDVEGKVVGGNGKP